MSSGTKTETGENLVETYREEKGVTNNFTPTEKKFSVVIEEEEVKVACLAVEAAVAAEAEACAVLVRGFKGKISASTARKDADNTMIGVSTEDRPNTDRVITQANADPPSEEYFQEEENLATFHDLRSKFMEEYEEHRYERALVKAKQLEEFAREKKNFSKVVEASDRFFLEEKLKLEDTRFVCESLQQTLAVIDDEHDWITESQGSSMTIKYKREPNSASVSMKLWAELEVPIFAVLTLANEVPLLPRWLPFCGLAENMKQINRTEKLLRMRIDMPMIADREALMFGVGINRIEENGTVFIMVKSIDKDPEFQRIYEASLPGPGKCVRMDMKYFGFELRALSPTRTAYRAICNVNPNVDFLPNGVLAFVMRKFSVVMFEKMIKIAKNFKGSAWEQRMELPENRAFYSWLSQKVDDYLANHVNPNLQIEERDSKKDKEKEKNKKKSKQEHFRLKAQNQIYSHEEILTFMSFPSNCPYYQWIINCLCIISHFLSA
eukprot:TRINITY_DN3344_c0_g1_i11.p1 TRINITY_DN3344_c0_g1~~TRINITY_DN3344_c0_g1_i11.p1  ORF type:complete len:494 (+),score=87.85 TRINITY_DN3344_c0_g1_i11:624-2105(+)